MGWNKSWLTWKINSNSQIKFETSKLKWNLCDYSDMYIIVKGTILVASTAETGAGAKNGDKKVIFKKLRSIYCLYKRNRQYTSW